MKNYIETRQIVEQFNIARTNLYYWVKNNKISRPVKNSTNHYMWEQKHIEEIKDVLKKKYNEKLRVDTKVDYFELNNRRYLGNKYRLIPFIKNIVTSHCEGSKSFFDVFSGTGVVADAFYNMNLITNDLLYSNYISHYAFFSNDEYDKVKIIKFISKWNKLKCIKEDNYMSINFGEKYFSAEIARKIGFIRQEVCELVISKKINRREEYILISSLIYAMDKIANTCGHYDAYRKNVDFQSKLVLKFPNIKNKNKKTETYNMDSNILAKSIVADIAYIDPPYNSRQYSDAYHLLENVAKWEKPDVFGIAAKMDRTEIKSEYCTKKAPEKFRNLIENINSKYILVSYNNMAEKGNDRSNSKISDTEIISILEEKGEVQIFEKEYRAFTTGKSEIDNHKERLFLCKPFKYHKNKKKSVIDVASPLNYTGGKYKLLEQMKPKFPNKINSMIDLFSGGCNVGINIECKNVKFVDKQPDLIRLFNTFKNNKLDDIINQIECIIKDYELSNSERYGYDYYKCNSSSGLGQYNKEKYLNLRNKFNSRSNESFYYDIMFYILIVYGFNNQIRFNQKGHFNLPVGKRDFNIKMRNKLFDFINRLKGSNYEFIAKDFLNLRIDDIDRTTFVYADPPYLITTATYNEQGGWNENYEEKLLEFLDKLNDKGVKFALSNVIESKGKRNQLLINWTICNKNRYKVHYLDYDYSNSNYQTKNRNKNSTVEVLITNY